MTLHTELKTIIATYIASKDKTEDFLMKNLEKLYKTRTKYDIDGDTFEAELDKANKAVAEDVAKAHLIKTTNQ